MCCEGGCCGPCCSPRSWLITHIVFVKIFAIGLAGTIWAKTIPLMEAANARVVESGESIWVTIANYEETILLFQLTAVVVHIVWYTLGWVLVRFSSKGVHIAYVVCCGIDMVINICMIIVTVVMLGELGGGEVSGMIGSWTLLFGREIASIAIMDIAPMLCFCLCQQKTLSMYSDGVDPDRPTGQGVVYASGPQTIQGYPNPNAGCRGNPIPNAPNPGNPHHNAAYPHGSDEPPAYTEVQKD